MIQGIRQKHVLKSKLNSLNFILNMVAKRRHLVNKGDNRINPHFRAIIWQQHEEQRGGGHGSGHGAGRLWWWSTVSGNEELR